MNENEEKYLYGKEINMKKSQHLKHKKQLADKDNKIKRQSQTK